MSEVTSIKPIGEIVDRILDKYEIKKNDALSKEIFGATEKELFKRFDSDKNDVLSEKEAKNLSIFKQGIIWQKFDINHNYKLDDAEIKTFISYIEHKNEETLTNNLNKRSGKNIGAIKQQLESFANQADWENAERTIEKLDIPNETKKELLKGLIKRIEKNKNFEKNVNTLTTSTDDAIKSNILEQMSNVEILAISSSEMNKIFEQSSSFLPITEDGNTIGLLLKKIDKISKNPVTNAGRYFEIKNDSLEISDKPTDLSKLEPRKLYDAWYKTKKEYKESTVNYYTDNVYSKTREELFK